MELPHKPAQDQGMLALNVYISFQSLVGSLFLGRMKSTMSVVGIETPWIVSRVSQSGAGFQW